VAEERRKRHLVTQRLAQQRTEADKTAQQKQEHWDTKYRELQKEKYAMSIRLQVLLPIITRPCFNCRSLCFLLTSTHLSLEEEEEEVIYKSCRWLILAVDFL
jgi:hypothetical protein